MTIKLSVDEASDIYLSLAFAFSKIEHVLRVLDETKADPESGETPRRRPTITGKQCQTLIRHFDIRESISPMEAWTMYGVRCLHRRILDLEANGWQFRRERRVDPTGQRYVRYFLIEKGVQ